MDPALLYGPYGLLFALVIAVVHLYRENTRLRDESLKMLKTYQDRDEEERLYRQAQDRKAREGGASDERRRLEGQP
jgi:hypothetical protein